MKPNAAILRDRARRLRRNQTEAERRLWARLRSNQLCGFKFRRQYPIDRFIVDFCCFERRLVVELDGGQHATQTEADQKRTHILESSGYGVLRFWDNEVLEDINAVMQRIAEALDVNDKRPSPLPSPKGRG
jgi:very-short-patch-repair endonuclease